MRMEKPWLSTADSLKNLRARWKRSGGRLAVLPRERRRSRARPRNASCGGCEAGLVVGNEDSNQHGDAEEDEQKNDEVAEVVAA